MRGLWLVFLAACSFSPMSAGNNAAQDSGAVGVDTSIDPGSGSGGASTHDDAGIKPIDAKQDQPPDADCSRMGPPTTDPLGCRGPCCGRF
jgi:hypothetical protein